MTQIKTTYGDVRGHERDGVVEILGIPFASAPRFAPPQPPAPWRGAIDGDEFGPASLQPPGDVFMAVDLPQAEECLSLNVWTPACDDRSRPVLVWIHGGGFRQGGGSHLLTGGTHLPRRHDVVVVTCNYRLGALGFAAHPALAGDSGIAGNFGLLDQIAALEWVRDNIAAFGGDPGNVTLFGESAGGASVALLMASPRARDLFHRAVVQSGAPTAVPLERAASLVERLAGAAGLSRVEDLRELAAADVLAAQVKVEAEARRGMTFVPAVDGVVIDRPPMDAIDAGSAAGIPTIVGTNVDEVRLLGAADPHRDELDDAGLQRRVARTLGDGAADVIDVFRRERSRRGEPATPSDLWFAIESDRFFRVPAIRFADAQAAHAPTFVYLFAFPSPGLDGWLRACHVLDVPFVFGHQGRADIAWFTGAGEEADVLAGAMMAAWSSFAATGVPRVPGPVDWPAYDVSTRPTLVWDTPPRVEAAPRDAEREVVARWSGTALGV
ncbi:MAG TPA: carboxylesterase family protein [Acidimicrobiales bacterium]|nr:carboxylesterase family protein [Acidimicrobiales bacterium]